MKSIKSFAVMAEVNGCPGMVSERIYGEPLMERFIRLFQQPSASRKWKTGEDENIRITARSLCLIHSRFISSMPPQQEMLKWHIRAARYLTPAEKEQLADWLDRLPVKRQLCHEFPTREISLCGKASL